MRSLYEGLVICVIGLSYLLIAAGLIGGLSVIAVTASDFRAVAGYSVSAAIVMTVAAWVALLTVRRALK
tara:strand:+ start:353 stop:559 length:207 start_codon:yes stop_codon:yes gene_type:complete